LRVVLGLLRRGRPAHCNQPKQVPASSARLFKAAFEAEVLRVGHAPTDSPEVRRVALGFDERVPERFKDNLRQAQTPSAA